MLRLAYNLIQKTIFLMKSVPVFNKQTKRCRLNQCAVYYSDLIVKDPEKMQEIDAVSS